METENENRQNVERLVPYRAAAANLRKITPTALMELIVYADECELLNRLVRLEKPRH